MYDLDSLMPNFRPSFYNNFRFIYTKWVSAIVEVIQNNINNQDTLKYKFELNS